MPPIRLCALALPCLLATLGAARAAVTATQTRSVTDTTDFGDTLTFDKFDPALGTLTGVTYALTAGLQDVIGLESLDHKPITVHATLTATVTLRRPDGTTLAVAAPGVTRDFAATAFDGAVDFGGTSGVTYDGMGQSIFAPVDTVVAQAAADLALFTGPGTIALPVNAVANSSATGSGNVVSTFQTDASAAVSLFYAYTPTVAMTEPMSLALLGAGMVGIGLVRRPRPAAHASR